MFFHYFFKFFSSSVPFQMKRKGCNQYLAYSSILSFEMAEYFSSNLIKKIAQYLIPKKFFLFNMTLLNGRTKAKNVIITFVATEVSG